MSRKFLQKVFKHALAKSHLCFLRDHRPPTAAQEYTILSADLLKISFVAIKQCVAGMYFVVADGTHTAFRWNCRLKNPSALPQRKTLRNMASQSLIKNVASLCGSIAQNGRNSPSEWDFGLTSLIHM